MGRIDEGVTPLRPKTGSAAVCHVLIIEDEILVALDLQAILKNHGASSFAFAANENDAVKEARLHPPAFISSDVHLEQGTGHNAVCRIHEELGFIPTMYVTGTPGDCEGCPPEHVLTKPLVESRIVALFRELAPV